jgi:predicted HAD superfamily Cof-like phosphohydrolase
MKTNTQKATEFCRILELKNSGEEVTKDTLLYACKLLDEEVNETNTAVQENDLEEILDGFADVAFVAINGIYKSLRFIGYHDVEATQLTDEVFKRVCDANLAKLNPDGSVTYNEFGKVQKPAGWKAPTYGNTTLH